MPKRRLLLKSRRMKVIEEENVPETVAVQKTMEAMIRQDGAQLIFPTHSAISTPTSSKWQKNTPDIRFAHSCGLWQGG